MKNEKAIQRTREVMRRQHRALSTEETYLHWLRHYITAIRRTPENLPSEKKVEQLLTDLARNRDVAASTQNQALNAILFFYKHVLGRPLGNIDALRAKRPDPSKLGQLVGRPQVVIGLFIRSALPRAMMPRTP